VTGNRVVSNGSWGILLVPFPDLGTPPPIAHCEGGTTHGPLPGCYYDDWANTVSHNTFTHNGFFGNPTNGDAGDISGQNTPGNCWFGNVNTNATPITSEPPDIQSTHGTCGVPNQGAGPTSTLAVQVICANQLLGPCPPSPGMAYPRTTRVVMPRLPRGLRTMPNPCRGVPPNAFCTRAPRFTG
jgi:hypothetical protein